jgi:hypothetical protein
MRVHATVALLAAVGCDRGHPPAPPSTPTGGSSLASAPPTSAAQVADVAALAGCTLAPDPLRLPAPKRLIAVGDLHGDLGGTRAALRAAGAIDADDRWIGGDLVVVQTGDVLDRGDDESKILDLLVRLEGEARAAGGALIALIGNHELMNAAGDFRYVTPVGARDFGGDRVGALGPGGAYAKRFAHHDVVRIVGDTVFSHAGVLGDWAAHAEDTNLTARCWLDGQAGDAHHPPAVLTAEDSPVWTRAWGIAGSEDCRELDRVLAALEVRRMVVAHTVQPAGITSACNDKLWRIDVGLATYYGGPIEVLAIDANGAHVLRGKR